MSSRCLPRTVSFSPNPVPNHGVDRACLEWSRATGRRESRITRVMQDAAAHNRRVYREALPGLALLAPVSRPCIRTAFVLYSGILDAIEDDGYAVLHRRAVVPRVRRAAVALDGLMRALAVRSGATDKEQSAVTFGAVGGQTREKAA